MKKTKSYCSKCGALRKAPYQVYLTNLCKKCNAEIDKKFKEKERLRKEKEQKIKDKIIEEFKPNDKIRELENIFNKPCTVEVNVANMGTFLFGRFVKRKFTVTPLIESLNKLKGEYKNIDDFCEQAKRKGFGVEQISGVELSLILNNKRYNFFSDGIYRDKGRIGAFARVLGKKVANVKYKMWKSGNPSFVGEIGREYNEPNTIHKMA